MNRREEKRPHISHRRHIYNNIKWKAFPGQTINPDWKKRELQVLNVMDPLGIGVGLTSQTFIEQAAAFHQDRLI